MTEHSLLGASSAHRWLNCPGSFKLSQTAPHRPSSIYAATGTLAHEMIEQAVHSGTLRCDESGLGQLVQRESHTIEVDQDLIDGVNEMLEYLKQVTPGNDFWVEFRVDLDSYFPISPPVPVFGTVDAGVLDLRGKTLEVVDYKNGSGITVSAVENPQLMFYAAGALCEIPPDKRDRVRTIRLTIVQPNAGGFPVRSWDIDVVDLLMWVDEVLVPGVEACTQDDAPLNPGTWCRFCPVSHACPKLMADAIEMAKHEFDDEISRDAEGPGKRADQGQEACSVDAAPSINELAKALDTAERAELWITRIREFALDQLQHQVHIPGWGLVPTRPTRKWLYPEADLATRLVLLGVNRDEIWEQRMRSPAQLEKTLHRTRKGRLIWDQAAVMVEARSSGVKVGRDHADARGDFDEDV